MGTSPYRGQTAAHVLFTVLAKLESCSRNTFSQTSITCWAGRLGPCVTATGMFSTWPFYWLFKVQEITYWGTWRPLKTIWASFTSNPLCSNRTGLTSRACWSTLSTSSLTALLTPAPHLERQKNTEEVFSNRQRLKQTSVSLCLSTAVGAGAFGVRCKCIWNNECQLRTLRIPAHLSLWALRSFFSL